MAQATLFDRSALLKVGRDKIVVDPTVRRYTGMVAGLREHDVLIIESIDTNGVSLFGPAAGASVAASAGV